MTCDHEESDVRTLANRFEVAHELDLDRDDEQENGHPRVRRRADCQMKQGHEADDLEEAGPYDVARVRRQGRGVRGT